jgi:uncharacterized protein (DUF169 family)
VAEQHVSIRVDPSDIDWQSTLGRLDRVLRIKTTPIGMKMFETAAEMEAIAKIRRPSDVHTADQIVSMASRLNWTVGITGKDLVGAQCQSVLGLGGQDDEWFSGKHMAGVWFETTDDAAAHQAAMNIVPNGTFQAMAVSPLSTGRLAPPDICLVYATPGQMIILINGLQWSGYKKLDFSCVGESACADSWGKALATGEPSLSLPCYAERRYGGVPDDELLIALKPEHLVQAIDGMEALSRNGLRYPIPPYGIQTDARAGLGVSYGDR